MKRASRTAYAALLVLSTGLVSATTAYAQAPPKGEKETARLLFEDGKSRRDRGDKRGALEAFSKADAIMKVPTTKLAVARAFAALDMLLEAREAAALVGAIPLALKEPVPFTDARQAAAELLKELDERIPSLTIIVEGARADDAPVVTVDGQTIAKEKLASPLRLNPGKHSVVGTLNDKTTKVEATLAEKASESVTLVVREPEKQPNAPATEPPKEEAAGGSRSPLLWIGLGVAVVGVGVGTVGGIISTGKTSEVESLCRDGKCPPPAHETLDAANTWATISTIGFIGAGVGLALAGVGLALGRGPSTATATTSTNATRIGAAKPKVTFVVTSSGIAGAF